MITIYLKQYNKIIRNADPKLFDELGYDDILWIDLLNPTIKEQKAVEGFMEISLQTKQQVEEIESTSKYSETENAIISNSNFFVPTGDSFVVQPVSFIISNEGVLVSVRTAEFRTFREAEKRLQMSYRSFSTGYHLFISLLEVRIDYDADLVEMIAKQVAALSKDINSEDSIDKKVIHRINALLESTMLLRENIFDRQRHRELTFGGIRHSLQITSWMTGRVLIIMFTAYAFERLLVQYRIPDMIVEHILGFTSDVAVIWMFVIALLLFLGMFMETLAIILLATPVLLPVMTAFGVDPIHFGVVLVCCCGVGFSTPPLGENIFIASGIADTTLEDISYNALPFVFVTVGVIILCVFVPDIVLFLPRMMY